MQNTINDNGAKSICLIIWSAIFCSAFVYPPFLDNGYPLPSSEHSLQIDWVVLLSLLMIGIATVVRWLVIPKVGMSPVVFPLLIIGLAFTEATIFFEIFLLGPSQPNEKALIYWLAIASMLQFFPLYIRKREAPPAIKQFD